LHYSNNCQCEKDGSHCRYCQSDDFNKKSCSCQKEKQISELEEKLTKTKKEKKGKETQENKTIETENKQLQEQSEKNSFATSEIRNILLIGRTGNGKSTLANVLTGTNKFRESPSSTSETRKLQTGEFVYNSQKYKVVDTIGISDTQLTQEEVLNQLLQAIHTAKNGINQIFLVINGKLTKEEIATYHLLRDVIFTNDISQHITVVRTNFPDFQDQQKCEEDREKIKKESEQLSDIANSSKIIYVNNPVNDSQNRENSRTVLLEYLTNYPDIYKSSQLDELVNNISNYINKVEKLEIIETRLKSAKGKQNNKKEIKQLEKDLKKVQSEKESAFKEIMKQAENKKE